MIRIIILLLFSAGVFAQNFSDDSFNHEKRCSHQQTKILEAANRSFENPNPLLDNYDVKFYGLNLEVYDTTNLFSGSVSVLFKVVQQPMDTFLIEIWDGLSVDSVLIEGNTQSYIQNEEDMAVLLSQTANIDSLMMINIFYHTPEDYSTYYFSSTIATNYCDIPTTQTMSEPYFAHQWFPCKQELTDKADSVYVNITTDTSLHVASLGTLNKVELGNGKRRWEWHTHQKTAYYLIAFAVADYQEYKIYAKPESLPNDSILVLNYLYDCPGVLENNKTKIDQTVAMIELLSNRFGLYPFHEEKYGHYMFTPPFYSGMENLTMTGMRYFSFNLISHELGHSWFGDNVTCATWSDIWINEGFASYTQYIAGQELISQASADALMQYYHDQVMSQPDGSVYIPEEEITSWGRIFNNRLSYRKGSAIIHTLRYLFNSDSLFFESLRTFQSVYADSIATGLDFINLCEAVSGNDFTDFYNQWYVGEGYPTYDLIWWQENDTVNLQIHQETSTAVTPLFTNPVDYLLYTNIDSDTVLRIGMNTNDTTIKIYFPQTVYSVDIDPDNWVVNKDSILHRGFFNLKALLQGPFDTLNNLMSNKLNPDFIPLEQPFNTSPWFYEGNESVENIPHDSITDWVLIEERDAQDAYRANSNTIVTRQAGFITKSGRIVGLDGSSLVMLEINIEHHLYIVIHHRNHLPILSSAFLQNNHGLFEYDFSDDALKTYGGEEACAYLGPGKWAMIAADANGDGIVDENDLSDSWILNGGTKGYHSSDFNLDSEINNLDKDDFWYPNLNKTTAVPQ